MTSFAFILGCVPLAMASGAGAIARQVMGTAVIGGMLRPPSSPSSSSRSPFMWWKNFLTAKARNTRGLPPPWPIPPAIKEKSHEDLPDPSF